MACGSEFYTLIMGLIKTSCLFVCPEKFSVALQDPPQYRLTSDTPQAPKVTHSPPESTPHQARLALRACRRIIGVGVGEFCFAPLQAVWDSAQQRGRMRQHSIATGLDYGPVPPLPSWNWLDCAHYTLDWFWLRARWLSWSSHIFRTKISAPPPQFVEINSCKGGTPIQKWMAILEYEY